MTMARLRIHILTLLFLTLGGLIALPGADLHAQGTGVISGTVQDAASQATIPAVHIQLLETEQGTVTDEEGRFRLEAVPAGIYTVRASFMGYGDRVYTDVVVQTNRSVHLEIALRERVILGEEITVGSGYFFYNESLPVSHTTMNAEEIRRFPGSGQELSRVIMNFPGVASTGEMSQDLMVRGGSPRENLFYIDNIWVPAVQHFEEADGSSNGPTGLINTDLVEHLDFSAGGFSATYGGRMSSVADMRYRDGSREGFQGSAGMNMAGFSGILEAPFAEGDGSWLISARRSYLDLIGDAINSRGAPRYGDIQARVAYDTDSDNRFSLLHISGSSLLNTTAEEGLEDGWLSYPRMDNRQYTTGVNWRRFWSGSFTTHTSLSWSVTDRSLDLRYSDDSTLELASDNRHDYLVLRSVTSQSGSGGQRIEFGLDAILETGRFNYYHAPTLTNTGVSRPVIDLESRLRQFTGELFGSYLFRPVEPISVTIGSRIGFNHLNRDVELSPRMGVHWEVSRRLSLNAAAGIYRQALPLVIRSQQPEFKTLRNPRSLHLVTGAEYLLGESTMLSLEFYEKRYDHLPVQPEGFNQGPSYVFDSQTHFDELLDNGTARARGIDLMVQRKIKEGLYGSVTLSLFRSQYRDHDGRLQNRDYDVKSIFSVVGGYRPNNRWEFSARWSYVGARPYTPIDVIASADAGQTMLDISRYNSDRLPAFHSLYLRMDRRFYLKNLGIVAFMEVWNSYNRSNVTEVYWNLNEQRVDEVNQFDLLPVGGFIVEF